MRNKLPDPGKDAADSSAPLRFLTLWVGERCYALRAEDVREIMHVPAMTRVPQGPAALLGIANLRGSVLPVASLRGLLGVAEGPPGPTARAIVLNGGLPVAITVDSVDALVAIASDRIQVGETELEAAPGERLNGSFRTGADHHAARVLDIKGLLDAAFTHRARSERLTRHAAVQETLEAPTPAAAKAELFVTFEVAGQEFAFDLGAVQEILPAPSTRAAVPHAEGLVLGVTSHRGSLLPLLSLRGLLGFPLATGGSRRDKVVVMNIAGAKVGLVADHARAVVAADPSLIDPVPVVVASRMGGESRLRAIYRAEGGRRLISVLAPERLFREDVMQRINARRDVQAAPTAEVGQVRAAEQSFVVFRLGSDEFALPIDAVEEIAQVPAQIRRVPKTPKFLEGVINLRGSVLPVIDQRRRFEMPKADDAKGRRLIVVKTDRHRAGLIVDGVSDVLRIPVDAVTSAPDLTDDVAKLVRGVINLEHSNRIVLVLDSSELLTRAERGLLDKFQAETAQANA